VEKKVIFAEDRCKGCELCTTACPKGIVIMGKHLNSMGFHPATVIDQDACISCGHCYKMCPDSVITVKKEEKK
jgi:2-oxoglutarate ferredoxin oxidoreductase subunit delta